MSTTTSPRVWFITGSSTGLGRALSKRVLARGDRVFATARNPEQLADLVAAHPGSAQTARLDVTRPEQVRAAVDAALEAFGRIDVLVNNAGAGLIGALEEVGEDQVRRAFEVLFFGPLEVTRALLPTLRRQRQGHILNMSAIAGFSNELGFSVYGGAKFALEGVSEALRGEVSPLGIKVTIVEPGPFRTDFIQRSLARAEHTIADYHETVGKFRDFLDQIDGTQPGDPEKAADAMIRVVEAENPPLRLVLGKYAYQKFREKLVSLTAELDAWEDVGANTDFGEGVTRASDALQATFSAPIDAPVDILWRLLEDKIENPGRYVQGATDARIIERFQGGVLRQMTVGSLVLKERISSVKERQEITFTLVDHPTLDGYVVNRVLRQSDAASVVLEFTLYWAPKRRLAPDETPDVAALIRAAVLHTKEIAESEARKPKVR